MSPSSSIDENADPVVVRGFGDEWMRFDQLDLDGAQKQRIFEDYFSIFPWSSLPPDAIGADFGCGSGRWAMIVAERVKELYCIDPSAAALAVAKRNLRGFSNCRYLQNSVGRLELEDGALDFGYSLGVLHHVPNTLAGLKSCVAKLKPGAPFLVYLYYRFDNRPRWFRATWALSDLLRRGISKLPYHARFLFSQIIAICVYWPIARTGAVLERLGMDTTSIPLHYYSDKSFYVMRTDALDRFGTRLERRFTREEIKTMMINAGLGNIEFSTHAPYWCAVGIKAEASSRTVHADSSSAHAAGRRGYQEASQPSSRTP